MSTHRIVSSRGRRSTPGFEAILPWSPVLIGVGVVIGYLIWVAVLPGGQLSLGSPGNDPGAVPPPVPPASAAVPASPSAPASLAPTEPPALTEPPGATDPPAPPPDLVGKYRLEALYDHEFIGKVAIVNGSDRPRDWRLELTFPADVGELTAFEADGASHPEVQRSGNEYVFTSAEPLAPVSWLRLRLRFERSGDDIAPIACVVNGAPCG